MSTSSELSADRFRRLHAAQRVITSDLTLEAMLEHICQAACDVIEVGVSVLILLAPDDSVEHLVHRGVDDDLVATLMARTTGAEVCDALVRWPAFGAHVRSVDVLVAGEIFARLHVATPLAGQFSAADEELVAAMSRSVGSALEHAQLFDRAQRSTEWLHASGEIARALLADADIDTFHEIVTRAVEIAGADYGQLVVPTADGQLKLIATAGLGADVLRGAVYDPDVSDLSRSIVNAKTLRMPDVGEFLSSGFDNCHDLRAFMIAPLIDAQGTRGSIMLARKAGAAVFAAYELDLFATYCAQVALAMQFADARADAERLQVLETRHETARELHDIVMQRLFATGVGMHTLTTQLADSVHADQLTRHVRELDDTIDEIRDRVFGLRGDAQSGAPSATRFPRIALDAATTAREASAAMVRSAVRRGRRRSDWHDGSGRQQG